MQPRLDSFRFTLFLCTAYSIFVSILVLVLPGGSPLALVLLLITPGYVLSFALFPKRDDIEIIERILLGFGLSIVIDTIIGAILNFTPWGIRSDTLVVGLASFTLASYGVASGRMKKVAASAPYHSTFEVAQWRDYTPTEKIVTITVILAILGTTSYIGYLGINPQTPPRFTEFSVLDGTDGKPGFPESMNASDPWVIILGLTNHESRSVPYSVRIDLVGLVFLDNATPGFDETVEVNRTSWSWFNVSLVDGQRWSQNYTFSIQYIGPWKLLFLLYKDGDLSSAYRRLHIYVRVK